MVVEKVRDLIDDVGEDDRANKRVQCKVLLSQVLNLLGKHCSPPNRIVLTNSPSPLRDHGPGGKGRGGKGSASSSRSSPY